jgi:nucleotide-binding universal stress UspA family protein
MVTFAKIFVPHDGTEMSDKALENAGELAKLPSGKITLFYVVDERYSPASLLLSFIYERRSLEEAKKELRRVLTSGAENTFKEKIAKWKPKGVDVDIKVAFGSPAEEILQEVEGGKFDIIMMGTRSIKHLRTIRSLGSVARKVSENAACPVILVH